MARAGFCRSCGTNVWLLEDGSGTCGHPATDIEGVYEVEEGGSAPAAAPEAAKSTGKRGLTIAAAAIAALVVLVAAALFLTRPQLKVTRLVTDGAVEQGEQAKAVVTVTNEGKRAGSREIVLVVDGQEVGSAQVTVEPGAQKDAEIDFVLDAEPGDYVLMARGFDIAEKLHVLEPAVFEIAAVAAQPKVLHAGIDESGFCVATVENTGEADGDFEVEFALDGKTLGSDSVTVLGGSKNDVAFEFDVPGVGNHVLTANGVKAGFAVHAVARPAHGTVIVNKLKGGRNRLKMVNNRPTDVLVVLSQPGDGKPALLAVYLRSKSSHTISGIKDGTYQIYYSFGSDWCPTCKEFETDRWDGRFEGTDKFSSSRSVYTQVTLTFGSSSGGSPTEDVTEDEFPKM